MMFFRKGQVSFEFLFTYGWIISVVSVIVAFLFFSGLLNPNNFISDSCSIEGNYLSCTGYQLEPNGIEIEFHNKMPSYVIQIINVTLDSEDYNYCSFNISKSCGLDKSHPYKFRNSNVSHDMCFSGSCYCDYFNTSKKHGVYIMPNSDASLKFVSDQKCKPAAVNYAKKSIPFTVVMSFEDTNKTLNLSGDIYSSVAR